MTTIKAPLVVYLPDTCGVEISRYGRGNLKLGRDVYTYSRPAGAPLGTDARGPVGGTCPGATEECESVCYAKRIAGAVFDVYRRNVSDDVPPIPDDARLLRVHVSGDFDTPAYILNWVARLRARPDVTAWAYTRSWRCHSLMEYLEVLRALPNVQLFASMDASTRELPPEGWRRAWLWRDWDAAIASPWGQEERLLRDRYPGASDDNMWAIPDGVAAYVCPEETGRKPDCVACGYCFRGKKHDVVFLEHQGPPRHVTYPAVTQR